MNGIVGVAIHPDIPQEDDELPLNKGDSVKILEKSPDGWSKGEANGLSGWFPSNYVEESSDNTVSTSNRVALPGLADLKKSYTPTINQQLKMLLHYIHSRLKVQMNYHLYKALPQRYRHWVINHTYYFVDPVDRCIHTQTIESKRENGEPTSGVNMAPTTSSIKTTFGNLTGEKDSDVLMESFSTYVTSHRVLPMSSMKCQQELEVISYPNDPL